ncbi:conserved hypothetical protein [Luminiphilus syltensis NOR5-1B]|uniref:DUF481 domain-containing protein n=2 Tax=Luminiphilus TaxID=1341118 RepID=B8KRD7_9GAMM|nr:conserved hypothetical protein [Luminiphilus syltensis NOR5-1B]
MTCFFAFLCDLCRHRNRLSLVLLGCFSLLCSQWSFAHGKTDVVTLYNGDRLTGEIQSLLGGRLSLSTDAMGSVAIEWQEVASVNSDFNFDIRLIDGDRIFGNIKPGSKAGTIAFTQIDGQRELSWNEVIELRPVEDDLTDRIDIYMSANYAFTKASGVSQTEFHVDLDYEDEDSLNSLNTRATVSDTDEEKTTSSRASLSRRVWTDRASIYRQVFGGYESNDELGLDYRVSLGGGVGRYFIDTNQSNLVASVSLQVLEERSELGDKQESAEGVITLSYDRWRFDTPELNLHFDTSVYPSLTESGRVRADSAARIRWEIINDLFWDLSAWGSYDSSAIDQAAGQFDWGMTTGLGWKFK